MGLGEARDPVLNGKEQLSSDQKYSSLVSLPWSGAEGHVNTAQHPNQCC